MAERPGDLVRCRTIEFAWSNDRSRSPYPESLPDRAAEVAVALWSHRLETSTVPSGNLAYQRVSSGPQNARRCLMRPDRKVALQAFSANGGPHRETLATT